ncbi:secreted RxLR effector protein 161-like [Vicia villosa]|uniref:secreted RxLR effector protein 161-like n=1 Tax=Vicia villosa TaxID=3911 RepID=UPI00273BD716|nr:secreted RxLR effector protein 161-like [Vicia villosa]
MRFFLGVKVSQNANGIHLCQKKYAREVLERFNIWNCNSVKNPIVPGTVLSREGGKDVDSILYKQLMANPKEEHMMIAKRELRYLRGTLDFSLFYRRRTASKLLAYNDSDYAREVNDRKSTSGYVFLLSEAAGCWSSKK